MLAGMYHVGWQANVAMDQMGVEGLEGWRGAIVELIAGYDKNSIWDC